MTSTRASAVWLALLSLLAACANVLGIEDRSVDTAGNYPAEGYPGCTPGDCGGCLDVHQQACLARTACAEATNDDDCATCVCASCEQQVIDCQEDAGCADIWRCLRETRCDLSERDQNTCLQECGSVIQAHGGLNGDSFRAAAEVRSCAVTSACLSCVPAQVQQAARECTQTNGCQDCGACFDRCLCSGERFGECQRLCTATEDAPPAACSEADDCAACTACFDACACGGGAYDACNNLCNPVVGTDPDPDPNPDPPAACSTATSCVFCPDCVSQCTCSGGGSTEQCQVLCAPPAETDQCIEDPRGVNSVCDGCQGCIAQCTCGGLSAEYCRKSCQEAACCGTQSCAGSFSNCACDLSGADCYQQVFGACDGLEACEACACQQCPGELGLCKEIVGCPETFDCMRATDCKGSACLEQCRGSAYEPQAFAFAEALWACYRGSGCGCGAAPPPEITCATLQGNVQCAPYVGNQNGLSLNACCSDGNTPVEPVGTELSLIGTSNPCGLVLSPYFRNARACEPREQPNAPRYDLVETCPDANISVLYGSALLKGCCRADHTCGYFDDITGLGCLAASTLGQTSSACN